MEERAAHTDSKRATTGPMRALALSLLALAVPVAGAVWFPQELSAYEALLWLLALVPAFLLAFHRGWQGAATALALGMAILSVTYAGTQATGKAIPETLFPVLVAYIAITLGIGWFGQELARNREAARRPPRLLDDETQLPTWAYARRYLDGEFEAALRGRPLAVVVFELGGTPLSRDDGGLARFADVLRRNTRTMNISARQEEEPSRFLSVLTGSELEGASVFAHRVVSAYRSSQPDRKVSAGVAVFRSGMRSADELVSAAEGALSDARRAGGDRIRTVGTVVHTGDPSGDHPEEPGPVEFETTPESRTRKALVVGEASSLKPLTDVLEARDVALERVQDATGAAGQLHQGYDIVVIDVDAVGKAEELVRAVQVQGRLTQVLVVVGPESTTAGLAAMNAGAVRSLVRPLEPEAAADAVTAVLQRRDRELRASLERTHITGELAARQREVQRTLRETEERYRTVVDGMREVVFEIDPEGQWQFLNPAWERLGGEDVEVSLGRSFSELVHPDDREGIERQLRAVIAGRGDRLDVQVRLMDGRPEGRWVAVTGAASYDGDGQLAGIYGTMVDVTERRQLEDQLRQAQKMEAVGQLAGGIAHDFNNLLMAIRGHAEFVLEEADLDAAAAQDLRTIVEGTERATGLTRQLLAFSRKNVPDLRVLDLGGVLRGMRGMLDRLLGEDVNIAMHAPADGLAVEADESQIQQIILNLAMNGRDAMPGGGHLTLRLEEVDVAADQVESWGCDAAPGPFVRLTVRDTGVGMDETTAARIFEPFFTTKAPGKGTGLGLSTVYGIVTQSGGHIEVQSAPGKGSTFRVFLPRASAHPARAASEPTALARSGGGQTILVVEDEEGVRAVVRRILQRSGYVVREAGTAREALEHVASAGLEDVDLLMTDVVMPGMSGVELVERLRRRRPDLPVLFMSGYAEDEMIRRGHLLEGAFLKKPFQRDELLSAVEASLQAATRS